MRFTSNYFQLPKLLPKLNSKYYKMKMMNVPMDELTSKEFQKGLPHLYKRFLRLHSFIDFSTANITRKRLVGLYASIIRTKFQIIYMYPDTASVELVGDTDMFMKLRNIKQKYESYSEDERENFLEKHLNTLIRNNYLHYSIEDFVSLYNMLLIDISKNKGRFVNWLLAKNVSVLESGNDIEFVRNNLLYGSIFKFDRLYYLKREINLYGWRSLYNGTYTFSTGMKGTYNPKVVLSRRNLNNHVYIEADYKAKTRNELLNEERTSLSSKYKSIDSLLMRQRQKVMFNSIWELKNNMTKIKYYLDMIDENRRDEFNALFEILYNEILANNNPSVLKNYVSYLQYDSTKKNKFIENKVGLEKKGKMSRRKSALSLEMQKKEIQEIEQKVMNKTDEEIKDMVLFLEKKSKNLDTMKYGFIVFTHNVLTSDYLKKKFILPYIRNEL